MGDSTIKFLKNANDPKNVSDPCPKAEMRQMIANYKNNQLSGLNGKGFYLDHKVVDMIQCFNGTEGKPKINSLYLYLAKRITDATPRNDGRYTLIIVPAIKFDDDEEILMLNHGFEWHDTIEQHPPVNEEEIVTESKDPIN